MRDKHEKETEQPVFIDANRRGFLQGAAVAGGVAASGVAVAAESIELPAPQAEAPAGSKGYELTDYVRKYYQRARS